MTARKNNHHRMLYGGGELFVNRMGTSWMVDVFEMGSEPGDDPIYHACYGSEAEALEDAGMWRTWEPSDELVRR